LKEKKASPDSLVIEKKGEETLHTIPFPTFPGGGRGDVCSLSGGNEFLAFLQKSGLHAAKDRRKGHS